MTALAATHYPAERFLSAGELALRGVGVCFCRLDVGEGFGQCRSGQPRSAKGRDAFGSGPDGCSVTSQQGKSVLAGCADPARVAGAGQGQAIAVFAGRDVVDDTGRSNDLKSQRFWFTHHASPARLSMQSTPDGDVTADDFMTEQGEGDAPPAEIRRTA